MRTKALLSAYLFLVSIPAFSCALPTQGPTIVVTGPHEDGHYKAAIPRWLDDLNQEPVIRVDFAEAQPAEGTTLHPSYSVGKEKIVINVPAHELGGRFAYIRAFWPPNSPGMCGIEARSKTFGGAVN